MIDPAINPAEMPGIPDPKEEFVRLPKTWYQVTMRKAQGFTAEQICQEFGIKKRTVSGYADRAKTKLGYDHAATADVCGVPDIRSRAVATLFGNSQTGNNATGGSWSDFLGRKITIAGIRWFERSYVSATELRR